LLAGKYELISPAGVGGMATVWKAKMQGAAGFHRLVAVKRMRREFSKDDAYVRMFVEEARVGSQLTHQNLVQVFDFCGDEQQGYFLVMEWVDGISLTTLIRNFVDAGESPPWDLICFIMVSTLRGLAAAHDRLDAEGQPCPIIHRDATPSNIMLGLNGEVKLSDFGLARADDRNTERTEPGVVKGKLGYTAPEVLNGVAADERSDVFSMGVCLWESLAGKRLFAAARELDVYKMICAGDAGDIADERADLPPGLAEEVMKAIHTQPEKRHASAVDMADSLVKILRRSPVRYFKDRLGELVRKVSEQTPARD
jgi:serine/threonine-protein kinase